MAQTPHVGKQGRGHFDPGWLSGRLDSGGDYFATWRNPTHGWRRFWSNRGVNTCANTSESPLRIGHLRNAFKPSSNRMSRRLSLISFWGLRPTPDSSECLHLLRLLSIKNHEGLGCDCRFDGAESRSKENETEKSALEGLCHPISHFGQARNAISATPRSALPLAPPAAWTAIP